MRSDREDLTAVLASFPDPPHAAVALARELLRSRNAAITRGKGTVATPQLERIYAHRARRRTIRATQYAALAATAAQYADESWRIYTVATGGRKVAVFASASGAGRFALALRSRARTVRTI